jgi:hypothetical protein
MALVDHPAITRALSSLTGIFTVPHQALNCHCPQRRKEREGLGHPELPASFLQFLQQETG